MKLSAVVVTRNDNYGGNLKERATYCLNSAIDTYDEVIYVDWNSPTHSLLYDIKDNLITQGNLKHIVIPPEASKALTNNDPQAQLCCEVLARNIGLRRASGDYIISTNIDVIAPRRDHLEKAINKFDKNTFYTISRRHTDWDQIMKYHGGKLTVDNLKEFKGLRDYLIENSVERIHEEKVGEPSDDNYSIINCCGDFQIAPKHIWKEIRGMEEELIYCLHTDTNIQKKAVMHGFNLKALFSPALFHIDHGPGGGGLLTGINKKMNDMYRAVAGQEKTENGENWGFSDIEIEYEIF